MKTKKLFAILLSVLMILTLFASCASDSAPPADNSAESSGSSSGSSGSSASTSGSGSSSSSGSASAPAETEPLHISYMGSESHNWTYTLEEARTKGFATLAYYEEKMLENHNLICDVTIIDNEAYKTTLTGYLAANTLLDSFLSNGNLDNDVLVNAINNGRFEDINNTIPYSTGYFADLAAEGGDYTYLKAWNIAPDGGWYYIGCPDGGGVSFNFDDAQKDYLINFPLLSWYALQIRVDWLNKVGLSMPTTPDEFHEALVAFQKQDANGNGTGDERAFLGVGMANEQVFGHGTAGWFGLPWRNFDMNCATGKIENPVDFGDQYLAFIDYTAGLYEDQVVLLGEGGAWSYGANVAGNYASAQIMYPDNLITANTGDPNTQYEPLPIIQALPGVQPRIQGQSVQTANNGLSFRAGVELPAAAAYLDWLSSPEFYMLLGNGIEGKAYDILDDGRIYRYKVGIDITAEDEESYGDLWCYAPWGLFPQFQVGFAWAPIRAEYTSVQEALDAGEPYYSANTTLEEWKTQYAEYNWTEFSNLNRYFLYLDDFGTGNIWFDLNVNFATLATDEETEVISRYGTELTTYLSEMTTNYITGVTSTDTYESDIAFAYDNLGMQEYTDAMQSRVDRYLVAMGRDAVLG